MCFVLQTGLDLSQSWSCDREVGGREGRGGGRGHSRGQAEERGKWLGVQVSGAAGTAGRGRCLEKVEGRASGRMAKQGGRCQVGKRWEG